MSDHKEVEMEDRESRGRYRAPVEFLRWNRPHHIQGSLPNVLVVLQERSDVGDFHLSGNLAEFVSQPYIVSGLRRPNGMA
jgi:hypothetical protein